MHFSWRSCWPDERMGIVGFSFSDFKKGNAALNGRRNAFESCACVGLWILCSVMEKKQFCRLPRKMQCIRAKPKLPSRNDTKIARLRPYSKTLLNEKFRIHSTIVKFSYKRLFLILRTTKAESDHRAPAHRDCLRQPKTAKSEAKKNPNRNQIQTEKILLKIYIKK